MSQAVFALYSDFRCLKQHFAASDLMYIFLLNLYLYILTRSGLLSMNDFTKASDFVLLTVRKEWIPRCSCVQLSVFDSKHTWTTYYN